MTNQTGPAMSERFIFPGLIATLHARPELRDLFPIGDGLAAWATG